MRNTAPPNIVFLLEKKMRSGIDLAYASPPLPAKRGNFMRQNGRQWHPRLERYEDKVSVKLTTYGYRFAAAGIVILLLTGLMAIA